MRRFPLTHSNISEIFFHAKSLFAKSRLGSAPATFAEKFLPCFAKIFSNAISIRCFRFADALFAKSRLGSAPATFAEKFLPCFAKIFSNAISIRCFRFADANLIRAVDSRAVFAACLACGRAVAHCVERPCTSKTINRSCFAVGGVTVIASAAKQSRRVQAAPGLLRR